LCEYSGSISILTAPQCAQTDRICADFERRIRDIAPGLGGGAAPSGGAGPGAMSTGRNAHMAAGSALAACAAAQQQQGSILKAALGALVLLFNAPRQHVAHVTPCVHQVMPPRAALCPATRRSRCTST
jgi:hypothetical protein